MIPGKVKFKEFLTNVGLNEKEIKNISYETFGKETYAFIRCGTMKNRAVLEKAMQRADMIVNKSYWPGQPVVMCRVRYFKAKGWDE